jgi:hypothetical protein
MGGWKVMCQMEISETATQRAQFRDMFNAHAGRALSTANLLPDVLVAGVVLEVLLAVLTEGTSSDTEKPPLWFAAK